MTPAQDGSLVFLEASGPSDWKNLTDPRVTRTFYRYRRAD
jgi:hypothetical protein